MIKRVVDIVLALAGLALLAVPILLIALLIALGDWGPVFFRQTRVGRHRRPFRMIKFRTMVTDADKLGPHVTAKHDPRITPVGRVLRRTKLDELPELWNVLCGDMSLVGPRPEVPRYVEQYDPSWEDVFAVRPGLTDLATLQFRDEEAVLEGVEDREAAYREVVLPIKIDLMRQYIAQQSLGLDLRILVDTVLAITVGRVFPLRLGPDWAAIARQRLAEHGYLPAGEVAEGRAATRSAGGHRIVFLVGQLGGGGLERQLSYLVSTLDHAIYRPAVLVWEHNPDAPYVRMFAELGVPVYAVDRSRGLPGAILWMQRFIRIERPEVLHSYSFYTNFLAWLGAVGTSTIPVGRLSDEYTRTRDRVGAVRGALGSLFPAWIVANSEKALEQALADSGPTTPRNITLVRNGVKIEGEPAPLPASDRFEILGIGRMMPQKRWDRALRALAEFNARHDEPWRFRLAGIGPEEDTLRALCAELGLEEHVEFLGYREDIPALLAASHVKLLTSESEGTPNVILETMAAGRAAIVPPVGDSARLIRHGENGFVVDPDNPVEIAGCLVELATDRPRLAAMGEAGFRIVSREMNLDTFVEATLSAYEMAGWTR